MKNWFSRYERTIGFVLSVLVLISGLLYLAYVDSENQELKQQKEKALLTKIDNYHLEVVDTQHAVRYAFTDVGNIRASQVECVELMLEITNDTFAKTIVEPLPVYVEDEAKEVVVVKRYGAKELLVYLEKNKEHISKYYYEATRNRLKYCELVMGVEIAYSETLQEYYIK